MKSGWQTSTLGDVCELINRGIAPSYIEEGGICVLNQKCIRDHVVNYEFARRHDPLAKQVSSERFIQVGDVLVNSTGTGTLGRVAQVRIQPAEPTTVDTHVTIVRPKAGLFYNDFFGYMLVRVEDEIAAAGEGTSGQTELPRKKLAEEIFVKYPKLLPEQKRIVAVLDEAFAAIQTAIANTEKQIALTEEARRASVNSLFLRADKKKYRQLGAIAEFKNGLNFTKSSKGERVRLVGVGDFQSNYWVPVESLETVQIDGTLDEGYLLKKGDILVVRSNGNKQLIGRSMLVGPIDKKTSFSGFTIRIRPDEHIVRPTYLTHFLKTSVAREALIATGGGTNISSLSQKGLATLPIYVPDRAEQEKTVVRLEAEEANYKMLANSLRTKQKCLGELKQSLLHKAFTGELTANPKAAERELVGAGV